MLCLIPTSWLAFEFLDLGAAITNGLFLELGPALSSLFGAIPGLGAASGVVSILTQGTLGVVSLIFFPLHWSLYYRPDEVAFAFAIILPWLLTGTLTSALFCKSAKQGFDTGLAVGLGYALGVGLFPLLIQAILEAAAGLSIDIIGVLDGIFSGMTDLPYLLAVVTACVEGGIICGTFGAFIGSLKYDPEEMEEGKKDKKEKEPEPTVSASDWSASSDSSSDRLDSPGGSEFCPNCGTKVLGGDAFCPNCGAKM